MTTPRKEKIPVEFYKTDLFKVIENKDYKKIERMNGVWTIDI